MKYGPLFEKSLDLVRLVDCFCQADSYVYSVEINVHLRGSRVRAHVRPEGFAQILDQYPSSDLGRYKVSEYPDKKHLYHVSYILPEYEDLVEVVTVVDSTQQLVSLLGQDLLEDIQIQ